ncbi:MAG TPA: UDP-N-acetylmuramoyl-L-alanyl-D-glutamate--2,6-diaminopimelate ligase [Moraxellaceae bacterium]|nr:UDP-N-acetylmuramoyl-L-alanyl-D-glutamate--2,6-diaminopimelate ligase [Moraxellaceae bacterium]
MKSLQALWSATPAAHAAIPVSAIVIDSRAVHSGVLFVALRGITRDARDLIPDAIRAGAAAVFAEQGDAWLDSTVIDGVPVIVVPHLAQELGGIASRFYGEPSQHLDVLAVTGTNGKTSVANLAAGALVQLGRHAGVLGTLGNGLFGHLEKSTHTTLDALLLQDMLARFVDRGADSVALEASSHGLVQGRLNGTAIDVAIFTNLTRDHLDYHGNMDSYAAAKSLLFRWPTLKAAVINVDDAAGARYAADIAPGVRLLRYSQQAATDADIRALSVKPTLAGLAIQVATPEGECALEVPLLGRFNVSNLLAVLGGLMALGLPLADVAAALRQARPVPGRMEAFHGKHPTVVVDYAHTPDALEKVLSSLREHAQGHLVCVFGCGGDRDAGKRPEMGAIASRLADHVVVTSDNPRSEDPAVIIAQIMEGAGKGAHVEADRRVAIRKAILAAGQNDIVLVAGKGHEDYQEIAGVRHPFSDVHEVRSAVAQWRAA